MNYYNEFDPKAAAWLRELISEGLIPYGTVDERSITEVSPTDLAGYTQCHFFAGIGGWPYALRLAGWPDDRPVWTGSCPCQPFSCAGKGLATADERHLWPAFFRLIDACRPPIVFGEQVASSAVLGKAGRRATGEVEPVWLDGVFADLEAAHYTCGAADIPAASVGAPHIRQRLFWVANSESGGFSRGFTSPRAERRWAAESCVGGTESRLADDDVRRQLDADDTGVRGTRTEDGKLARCLHDGRLGDTDDAGLQVRQENQQHAGKVATANTSGNLSSFWSSATWHECRDGKARRIPRPEPGVLGMAHGLQEGLDAGWLESGFPLAPKIQGRVQLLKGYGNAIVPQVAAEFILASLDAIADDGGS